MDHLPPLASGHDWSNYDFDRAGRTGDAEVVFGEGKTPAQVVTALQRLHDEHPNHPILATRVDLAGLKAAAEALPEAHVDPVGRTVMLGPMPPRTGRVAVVSAGTTDAPVAHEALATLAVFGAGADVIADAGVAGVHRILAVRDRLQQADAIIVIAGMDGALPSVVGGLVGTPVVAVPTSVGYGASFGGIAALLTMLNSCAPGVVTVNIDAGFTAAVHAARIVRHRHSSSTTEDPRR